MKDLKQSYDKLLVAAAGLIALGIAGYIVTGAADLSTSLQAPAVVDKGEAFAPSTELARLKAEVDAMKQPAAWNDGKGSLFVSRIYLLREGRLVDIMESGNDLFPGIPNSWILEHSLAYTDPRLPEQDPDKDGFSNLEEYTGKTNPNDASSTPPVWTKLRMTDSKIEQLQILFTRPSEDGGAWINSTSGGQGVKGQSQLYPVGSEIFVNEFQEGLTKPKKEPTIFKLARVTKSEEPIPGIPGAVREVYSAVLQSSVDKKEIILEQEKPETSPYSKATLVDTRPGGQAWEGRAGQSFKMDKGPEFRLVEVFPDKAIIQKLDSEETFEVPFQVPSQSADQPAEPPAQ